MAAAVEGSDDVELVPIRVVSRRLVRASDASMEPHIASVSNLDLYAGNDQLSTVCLYPKLPEGRRFCDVVNTFETGLPSLLNHLYPLAGRITTNPSTGLPEIDCSNQGAELIVGEVGVALGSLDYGVATGSLKKMLLPFPEDVLLSVQLLSFTCGRFAVVWGHNHLPCDGYGITMLIRMWSEIARTGTIAAGPPNHDRSVFRPRDPPSYSSKLGDILTAYEPHRLVNALTAEDSLVERLYYIEASDIARLRETASTNKEGQGQRSTRVQAVSAYLWKVLAGVVAASRVAEERCRMGWWVDARRRLMAPPELASAMRGYFGNVIAYALADAAVDEVLRLPLADVAAMVRGAITEVNYDDYIADLVDYVELHKDQLSMESAVSGLGAPTLCQSAFVSFPLDTDFGFGQAKLAMPVVPNYGKLRLCAAFMTIIARPGDDGSWLVTSYVWPRLAQALESDDQRIFKPLTAKYLDLI